MLQEDVGFDLGRLYFQLGDFDSALDYFMNHTAKWENDPVVHLNIGLSYYFRSRANDEAEEGSSRRRRQGAESARCCGPRVVYQ